MSLTKPVTTQQESYEMPVEQARAFFDSEARRVTGMSGEEFIRRYDAGEIIFDDETPKGREVIYLTQLIGFGR